MTPPGDSPGDSAPVTPVAIGRLPVGCQVINEPHTPIEELADAEIAGFGDSEIDILVDFWMEAIDDGVNRVGADLLLMIWQALRDNDIEIPFPQREVKILYNSDTSN